MGDAAKIGFMLAGGAGVAAVGFVIVRGGIRREVERVLRDEYNWDSFLSKNWLTQQSAAALDLPSSKELAESVVPTWSLVMPEEAIDDILVMGRSSKFWPPHRRASKLSPSADSVLLGVLRSMKEYYAGQDAALETSKRK